VTRRKIGSGRRGRDSFVDDKTDGALSSVLEISETLRTKVMRPIGAGPLPPPHLVRNADLDPYIYEGIPWINRGRGILDPTPGNFPPLNRRLRREAQAGLGTPTRISAMRPSPAMTMSEADGPMAGMYDLRIIARPENITPIDEVLDSMQEIETRVDSMLGAKPRTLREATDNLKRLENLINAKGSGRGNFRLSIPYFASQMQPELSAVSPRFSGDSTPMSSYDYGVYYGVALNILEYPEAFTDTHLLIAAANSPDEPVRNDFAGGSFSRFPNYYSIYQRSRKERLGAVPDTTMAFEAMSGAQDMSSYTVDTEGNRVTSGGQVPMAITIPIYKSEGQKGTRMVARQSGILDLNLLLRGLNPDGTLSTVVDPPIDLIGSREEYLEFWQDVLRRTGEARKPIIDSVTSSILLGGIQEIDDLRGKIAQLKSANSQVPNENTLQSIRTLEGRMAEVYSQTNKATSLSTTLHEFGHALDYLGNYRNSPGHTLARFNASTGVSSEYERDRDIATLMMIDEGMDHPIKDDLARVVAREFVKEKIIEMVLSNSENLPLYATTAMKTEEKISGIGSSIASLLAAGTGDSGGRRLIESFHKGFAEEEAGFASVSPKRLQKTMGELISSGIVRRDLLNQPNKLRQEAEKVIGRLRQIGEESLLESSSLPVPDQYKTYKSVIEPAIDAAYERVAKLSNRRTQAAALLATAAAVHDMYARGIRALVSDIQNSLADAKNMAAGFEYASDWISRNISPQMKQQIEIDGGRTLLRTLISENPAAINEFMEIFARHRGLAWLDSNGSFSPTDYLIDLLRFASEKNSNRMNTILQVVNGWYATEGTNGWKDLTDDEIRLVQSAVSKLTDYAGPADYAYSYPPKFQMDSNKETYAELHPIVLMKLEKFMRKLTADERRAVEKLHAEMVARARSAMNPNG